MSDHPAANWGPGHPAWRDPEPWEAAHRAERASRTESLPKLTMEERCSLPGGAKALPEDAARALLDRRLADDPAIVALAKQRMAADVADDFKYGREVMQRHVPRRTPEAQADIAAARAAPTAMEVAMQELDHQVEQAARELRDAAAPAPLDATLSNAALADTPAVREMGGLAREARDEAVRALELDATNPGAAMYGRLRRELAHAFGVDPDTDWQLLLTTAAASALTPPGAIVLTGPEAERYRALQTAARKAQESAATARADGAALLQLFQAFCAGVAPAKEG